MKITILNSNPNAPNVKFDKQIVLKLAQPERLTKFGFWAFKLPGERFYWIECSMETMPLRNDFPNLMQNNILAVYDFA